MDILVHSGDYARTWKHPKNLPWKGNLKSWFGEHEREFLLQIPDRRIWMTWGFGLDELAFILVNEGDGTCNVEFMQSDAVIDQTLQKRRVWSPFIWWPILDPSVECLGRHSKQLRQCTWPTWSWIGVRTGGYFWWKDVHRWEFFKMVTLNPFVCEKSEAALEWHCVLLAVSCFRYRFPRLFLLLLL